MCSKDFPFVSPSGFLQHSRVVQWVKNLPAIQEMQVWSLGGKIPWRKAWHPTPVFLPGESYGQWRLAVYRPWGHKKSDTTEVTE